MRTRLLPLLIATSVLGTMLPATAGDVVSNLPTEPKKRLEAIQHALVNAAMEGNTRVRNAAWVDSKGQLHENTRITSDMKLRNVRVLNYLTVEDGVSAAIVAEGRGVTPDDEVCRANLQRYRREATLDVAQRIPANGTDAHEWQGFLAQARSRFVARAHAGRKWLLTASMPIPATSYERTLLGYTPDITPYQMVLDVLPAGALGIEPVRPKATRDQQALQMVKAARDYVLDEPEKRAPVPFVVRLSVYERVNQRLLWQDAVPLFFPERDVKHTSQPLPVGLLSELDNVIGRWQQRLDNEFACRPQNFNVLQESGKGWIINGGQAAGLAIGDQMLMMNREQLPARILEPDSGEHMALVEVTSVGNGRAVLRKLAGSASAGRSGDWVATPF
ncbi:MAG: hypothetical protein RL404_89 [Pseudomonadota bacterium]|jgi:hypothetical protein